MVEPDTTSRPLTSDIGLLRSHYRECCVKLAIWENKHQETPMSVSSVPDTIWEQSTRIAGPRECAKSCQADADAIATKHLDLDKFVVHNEIRLPMEADVFTLLDQRTYTLINCRPAELHVYRYTGAPENNEIQRRGRPISADLPRIMFSGTNVEYLP